MSGAEFHSLTEAADAIRGGQISSVELTQSCLDRITAAQDKLNCFVHVHEDEALAVERADQREWAGRGHKLMERNRRLKEQGG